MPIVHESQKKNRRAGRLRTSLVVSGTRWLHNSAMRTPLLLAVLLACSGQASADVQISLPLQGYYRPGRYLPLRVQVKNESGRMLLIGGDGTVPTRMSLRDGAAQGVAPLLALSSSLDQVTWRTDSSSGAAEQAMHALGADQMLVGVAAGDAESARRVFADKAVIPIRLDGADPLAGDAAAWSTLDAVVLDSGQAAAMGNERIAHLLAGGTAVIVVAESMPGPWDWRKQGKYCVLSYQPAGPRGAGLNAPAYTAVAGWEADWPRAFRVRVIIYGLLTAMVLLAAGLLRGKWAAVAGVFVSIIAVVLLALWWTGKAAVLVREGDIAVLKDHWRQVDRWDYFAAAKHAAAWAPWAHVTWPVFEEEGDERRLGTTLRCAADGSPEGFEFRAATAIKAAFLSRLVSAGGAGTTQPAVSEAAGPMVRLARRAYLQPGDRIVSASPGNDEEDLGQVEVGRAMAP